MPGVGRWWVHHVGGWYLLQRMGWVFPGPRLALAGYLWLAWLGTHTGLIGTCAFPVTERVHKRVSWYGRYVSIFMHGAVSRRAF